SNVKFVKGVRSGKFDRLFGGPPRKPETRLTQREMDIASSIQEVTEEIMMRMVRHIHKETGMKNLCLAGGVALNCVGNGRLLREGPFENIWIQPAAGDAGGAVGCALFTWYKYLENKRRSDNRKDNQSASLLGPQYSNDYIENHLKTNNIPYKYLKDDDLFSTVAKLLAGKNVVGWFQARMEFGPRALGARSIIGDPRSSKMQEIMNLKIKFRESFRPFAPSVIREHVSEYFELDRESPYMLLVAPVKENKLKKMTDDEEKLFGIEKLNIVRSEIPAVTHVDYSARIQTVEEEDNPRYYKLIKSFKELTGCSVIINTSFNVRGEPIVCKPEDAYRCFMRTNMDYLVMENYILDKKEQKPLEDDSDWQKEFELD
ncbi:MAG: carbamoyltransferase, partial [Nitrospinota bacterium]